MAGALIVGGIVMWIVDAKYGATERHFEAAADGDVDR